MTDTSSEAVRRFADRLHGYSDDDLPCEACDLLMALAKERDAAFAAGMERAAEIVAEGFDRPVGSPFRQDGVQCKNDKCTHGHWMYEDCEQCAVLAIRAAIPKAEGEG